ncbi:MAG: restriction endonuclease subunit S [Bacteroidaceae bacterium]|nr:restriction endonuclease subunit S [Bacteroidaceae bacterium]
MTSYTLLGRKYFSPRAGLYANRTFSASDTPHYENEAPFEVPKGWVWTRLCDITGLIEDCPHSTAKDEGSGFPLIRTPNVGEGYLLLDGVHRVSESVYNKRNARAIPETNDIIYAREAPAGNAAVIKDNEKVCLGQRTVLIRPLKDFVDSKLLAYFIISPYSRSSLISTAVGSTATHVNLENIRPFTIPLPPITEQHRIATAVDEWFSLIKELEQEKEDLQTSITLAKSKILDLAIHGKLVPQDPNDEPAIELLKRINPKFTPCDNAHKRNLVHDSWIWCTLQDSFDITMGSSPSSDNLNKENQGIEFHQGKVFFSDRYILPSDIYTTQPVKLAEPQSILLCVRAPVGTVNITDRQICIGRGLCSLKPSKIIDLQYAYYVLQTCSEELEKKATGSTFKAVGGDVVKKQTIPLPPLNEQQRIVAKIEELFAVLDEIQKSIEA